VDGKVYFDYDVNYWLYGCWAQAVDANLIDAMTDVTEYRNVKTYFSGARNDGDEKSDWTEAGWLGTFTVAATTALPGVAPGSGDPGPMNWHVGDAQLLGDLDRWD
jgi:hypothetical protein